MIYIDDQDKQNIHPNIMANNKKVQFSDKLKRYPYGDSINIRSENSLQVSSQKQGQSIILSKGKNAKINRPKLNDEPEVSYFEIDQLKELSKQISLKDASSIFSKRSKQLTKERNGNKSWIKTIMEASRAEQKLLQKIDLMLQKQSFKPIYSVTSRNKKLTSNRCYNTMASQAILTSQNQSIDKSSIIDYSKSSSPQPNNRTSTLSDLINLSKLSKLSNLSNQTLQRYLQCLGRDQSQKRQNQLEKSHKVSQFNLLDTERSKELTFVGEKRPGSILKIQKKKNNHQVSNFDIENEALKVQIRQIYLIILEKDRQDKRIIENSQISLAQMASKIKSFVKQSIDRLQPTSYTFTKKPNLKEQESTCLLDD